MSHDTATTQRHDALLACDMRVTMQSRAPYRYLHQRQQQQQQ